MTSTLPPLPLPFPPSLMQAEDNPIPVGTLPVPGGTPIREQRPFSLPPLGNLSPPLPPPRKESPPEKEKPTPETPKLDGEATKPDYTDADLTAALLPLVAGAMTSTSFHDDPAFESILRATFRRVMAEHQAGPFQDPGCL